MRASESLPGIGAEPSNGLVHTLREQVRQLEEIVLNQHRQLQESRQRQELFEAAAAERLAVIHSGDSLLRARDTTIAALESSLAESEARLQTLTRNLADSQAAQQEHTARLQRALEEAARGATELARRERALVAENLELRNEGLLHSVIRRLRGIFT